ncbi:hypothetical protein A2U01_0047088, partial [Trifolium medium]|nr:hypothetical protein [Trifolium medium]
EGKVTFSNDRQPLASRAINDEGSSGRL